MNYQIGDTVFNDWEIVRYIGRGASGVVYEIQKKEQGILHTSALKVLQIPSNEFVLDELIKDGMDERSVTDYIQSIVSELEDEVRIMVSLKGFPYIVNCEDSSLIKHPGIAQWDVLIKMELLTSFEDYRQDRDITEKDIHTMALHLTRALKLFEQQRIIHRDIKPENIFVNEYGIYKIGDFGIARVYANNSGTLSVKGTEYYMAPEVFFHQDYDHTVDIYSLGLVLYRALNQNRLPFYPLDHAYTARDRHRAMTDRISGKKEMPLPAMASPAFGQIILKMCAYHPEDRYQSADNLLTELNQIQPSKKIVLPKNVSNSASAEKTDAAPKKDLTINMFSGNREHSGSGDKQKIIPEENLTKKIIRTVETERPETIVSRDDHEAEKNAALKTPAENELIDHSGSNQDFDKVSDVTDKNRPDSINSNKKKMYRSALIIGAVVLAVILFITAKSKKNASAESSETNAGSTVTGVETSVNEEEKDIPDTGSATSEEASLDSALSNTVIDIPDPVLKQAVMDTLGIVDREITRKDALSLTEFEYDGYDTDQIQDLTGLSEFKNLERLNLRMNAISDIHALSELSNLTFLELTFNKISDISALSGLTNLSELNLNSCEISDISALSNLTALTHLDLQSNKISDISVLSDLTELTYLDLGLNEISDISVLSKLNKLTKLELGGNNLSDLSPLSGLTNLTFLGLVGNELSDLSVLSGLTNLEVLNLRHNEIGDLDDLRPLKPLTKLKILGLGQNYILEQVSCDEIREYLSGAPELKVQP